MQENSREAQWERNGLAAGGPNVATSSSNLGGHENASDGFQLHSQDDFHVQAVDLDGHMSWPFTDATLPMDFMFRDHVGAFTPSPS